MENTVCIANDQDIPRIPATSVMERRKFLNEWETSRPLGSCGLTMNGKGSFNISGLVPQSIWILDSGATYHMTPFPSYFTSYLKVSKKQLIIVVNGDHVPIAGFGNVQLHSSLSLHNVLHVTKLANNLVVPQNCPGQSLRHISKGPTMTHELTMGRTIGVAKDLEPFDLIHFDMWGPASNFISGAKWFVSFIDDCTHSDNGIEFVNLEFSKFLKDNGVIHELTKTRHLLEVARALLFQMSVPNVYWGEVVLTVTYLINRLPTRVLNGIKHMLSFFPSSPLMLSLPSRVFGCVAFVHSDNPHHGKLDPRAVKCVFIGYPSNKKGFKCYHPPSRRFFVSMGVTFHETQSYFVCPPFQGENYLEVKLIIESLPFPTQDVQVQVQEVTKSTLVLDHVQMSKMDVSIPDNSIENVTDDMPIALRKGKRSRVKYPISKLPIDMIILSDMIVVCHGRNLQH
ncbi:hypothetical protein CR513_30014, partial [Mucuna pruriens]